MKQFKIIDYYTDKQVTDIYYKTEQEAQAASHQWLKDQRRDGIIHNNLHIFLQIDIQN